MRVPYTNFKTKIGDEWREVDTVDIFDGKKIVVFAVPGAFTPGRSLKQLLAYEKNYDDIKALGVDDIYCLSVNDTLVMNAWFKDIRISKVKPIGDGEGVFTHGMGMLFNTPNQGFGMRSWRYSMLVDNGEIVKMFEEPGKNNYDDSLLTVSDADTMVKYLKGLNAG